MCGWTAAASPLQGAFLFAKDQATVTLTLLKRSSSSTTLWVPQLLQHMSGEFGQQIVPLDDNGHFKMGVWLVMMASHSAVTVSILTGQE